ncbi:hypothetical protein SAMN02745866_00276 [Alteromonadaceae bacterium Bs31]|nr:hypothetical protein SAMN02745866_00276 [Alteromonadaceae bacterium Bs31]
MENWLKKICKPILAYFEEGEGVYIYKKSHRSILKVVGTLLLGISFFSLYLSITTASFAGLLPIIVFFLGGLVCYIVAFLGSDRAVASIWKRK